MNTINRLTNMAKCNETFHGGVLQTRQNNKIQSWLKRVNGRAGRAITSLLERERESEMMEKKTFIGHGLKFLFLSRITQENLWVCKHLPSIGAQSS